MTEKIIENINLGENQAVFPQDFFPTIFFAAFPEFIKLWIFPTIFKLKFFPRLSYTHLNFFPGLQKIHITILCLQRPSPGILRVSIIRRLPNYQRGMPETNLHVPGQVCNNRSNQSCESVLYTIDSSWRRNLLKRLLGNGENV